MKIYGSLLRLYEIKDDQTLNGDSSRRSQTDLFNNLLHNDRKSGSQVPFVRAQFLLEIVLSAEKQLNGLLFE